MSKVNGAKYLAAPQYLVERVLAAPYDTNEDGCHLWKGSIALPSGYAYVTYRVGAPPTGCGLCSPPRLRACGRGPGRRSRDRPRVP